MKTLRLNFRGAKIGMEATAKGLLTNVLDCILKTLKGQTHQDSVRNLLAQERKDSGSEGPW